MSAALSALLARDPANSSTSLREERTEMMAEEAEHRHSTVSATLHKVMHNKVVKWSGLLVLTGAFIVGVWCLVTGHIPYFRKTDGACCPKPRCCKKPVAAAPVAAVDPCAAPKAAVSSDDCCAMPVDPCAGAADAAPVASTSGDAPAADAAAVAADATPADAAAPVAANDGPAAERVRRRRRRDENGNEGEEEERRREDEPTGEEAERRAARKPKKGDIEGKTKNFFERLRALKH
jgi:hypothetical protein